MCGLVGYVGAEPPVSRQRLVHMRDTLRHRGPDDAGLYIARGREACVGLGHRRLSIIDTREVGRQPLSDASGRVWVAFNGEVYNFAALRERLEKAGHVFRTRTDTEVLLYLYLERGVDMLDDLDGMFAFAIWDAQEERLLLARDRMGIKPLYVAERPDGAVVFASELKALLASKAVDDAIDLQAFHDYLGLNYVPGPRSILRGVQKLQPAHALLWERGRVTRRWRYWDQTFHSVDGRRAPSYAAAAEQVRAGLKASVRQRMVADVPLGMFLSGGIDSSAVLGAMSELATGPVEAFTIAFEEATYDESGHARIAAERFGARHHVELVRPDADTFLGPLTDAFDEPYADSSAIPLWYLCRLARRHVTVALGGDGGDELFAGYRTHYAWRLANLYRRLPAPLRTHVVPALVDMLPVSHGKVSFDLKARAFVGAAARPPADAHYGFKEFLGEEARHEMATRPAELEPTVRLFREAFAAHAFRHGLDAVLYSDFAIYLPDDILVKVDRMSMSHGLEARVPFLDHHLVAMAAGLPADFKLRGLRTKAVLKRAVRGQVPDRLLNRKKAGFNVPMASWLSGALRPLVRDMLSSARVQRMGLWRPEAVTRLLDEHDSRQRDHSRTVWALLSFVLFNERFRGGRPA